MTTFQCRAVDLEMNSCKRHGKHYHCTKGPSSFHTKLAEIKCDHQHIAEIKGEQDDETSQKGPSL
jgi:hypothetical protein